MTRKTFFGRGIFFIFNLAILSAFTLHHKNKAQLVIAVAQRFHAESIVLLHSLDIDPELKTTKGFKSIKILIEIQRMLSNNKIATLAMTLDEPILKYKQKVQWYKQNRPLYVVLDSGTRTQLKVAQVTSQESISGPIWLLMMDSSTAIPTFFNQIYVPFDCEFLVAQCNDKGIFLLTEVYRISNGSPLHQSYYGTWDYYRGLVTSAGLSIYSRRNNLFGLPSICVTNKNWPMNELVRGVDGKLHSIGFLGQTWELLASRVNLSFQMFIRPQQTTTLHWGLYFFPFSSCLWIALLVVVMVSGVYVNILQCISAHYRGVESTWSFRDSQLCVFGALCGQDQSPAVERDISKSVHLATLTIYFTGIILLAAYSGVLVSHFAVNKETLPFNDLQGFLRDGRYTFGILNQSAELEIFQDAKYGILNTVYRRHIDQDSKSIATSIFKGLLQACTLDKYVFLTPAYLAKAIIPRLPCKLVAVSDCVMKSNIAMAVTETSPYHGLFEYILQRLLVGGVLQKLYLGSFSQVSSWHSSWEKVGLEKVAPLLALLATGCAMAVLVLVGELNTTRVHRFKVAWSKPCSSLVQSCGKNKNLKK